MSQGRLRVGAAVGAGAGGEGALTRWWRRSVDVLLIDSPLTARSLGRCSATSVKAVLNLTCKSSAATSPLAQSARALAEAGCSAPGEVGMLRLHLYHPYRDWCGRSADHRCFRRGRSAGRHRIPVIADGGIATPAISPKPSPQARRRARCHGGVLCWPVPKNPRSEIELLRGRSYKSYRGMGSLGAMSRFLRPLRWRRQRRRQSWCPEGMSRP